MLEGVRVMPRDQETFERVYADYIGPPAMPMAKPLAAALPRYHPALRRRVRRFAVTAKPCADLAVSFPAAAALIATMERGPERTGLAVARVKGGAPLGAVAEALDLPVWTRKLPPEAFDERPLGRVATGEAFARQVGNALPKAPAQAAMWLAWVLEALRLGDEEFALWLAAQPVFEGRELPAQAIEPLAAYAFASARPDAAKDPLLTKRWGPRRPFAQAAHLAVNWLERVINMRCAEAVANDRWDAPSNQGGYRFQPLTTADQLIEEGDVMNNCLGTYVNAVARGECLIFSVRRGKRPVADLEIRPKGRAGEFYIVQLEGPGNSAAQPRVVRAVERWTTQLGGCPLNKAGMLRKGRLDAAKWRAEWSDFTAAHAAVSPLWREAAPEVALDLLTRQVRVLGEAAGRAHAAKRG